MIHKDTCPRLGYQGLRPVEDMVLARIACEEIRIRRLAALMAALPSREIAPKTKVRRRK